MAVKDVGKRLEISEEDRVELAGAADIEVCEGVGGRNDPRQHPPAENPWC
jgi:hypothetical protein